VRVLVTDAEYRLTLGAIRSVGRRAEVVALGAHRRALGFFSRYAHESVVGPAPDEEERFLDFLQDTVEHRRIDAILAIGQSSTRALSKHAERFAGRVGLVVPGWDAMQVADSKRLTVELARQLGVRTPTTYESVDAVPRFPVVAKRVVGSGEVRYLNERAELGQLATPGWLLQEYVPGEGRGLFALFDRGEERAVFMHRRLREYPVTGGASTAAESIEDPELRELGLRLLRALRWHGVAMVEFKHDSRDGGYTLMEINPKFWGSLDLAIAAGVDFPWLAVRLAMGDEVGPVPTYAVGLRFQWIFSDLLHAAARPRDLPAVLSDLRRARREVDRRDLKPSLVEALLVGVALYRRARAGTLRHPHGVPLRPS
jgi:predicted ATP-grasp superfamily ATP-dependent carboligase